MKSEKLIMKNVIVRKLNLVTNKLMPLTYIMLCSLFSLFFCYCSNSFSPPRGVGNEGTGVLSLTIGERGAADRTGFGRTIMPETVLNDFIRFDLNFIAKDNGNTDFNVTWTSGSGTVALNVGTWDLNVTAYLPGEDGNPVEAAKGGLMGIAVVSGQTVTGNVPLSPVMAGSGVFSWVIGYPENVISAILEIIPLDAAGNRDGNSSHGGVYTFHPANGNEIGLIDSLVLGAGEYHVIFRLTNENEVASLSEILHIYQNMESNFTFTFTNLHFPVSLLKVVLAAWDNVGKEWRFAEAGITLEHFFFLGIKGIDDDNFDDLISQFNGLCVSDLVPDDLDGFKALVDAVLIEIASEDTGFLDADRYSYQGEAEAAVRALALNGTALVFVWESDSKTVRVKAGEYEVELVFDNEIFNFTRGLAFTLIDGDTAYSVSRGTATAAIVVIPSVFNGLPVTAIANYGFNGLWNMTSVTIPASVTSIGSWAFSGCTGLTGIFVDDNNQNYASLDGILYNKAKTILIKAPEGINGSVTIPDSVTSIGNEAFSDCIGLTSVIIPDSVTIIGSMAFSGCIGLTSVIIPDSVTIIGSMAFWGCSGLTSVIIPDSVTSIGDGAFSGCTGLTSVTIPDSVTSIGNNAFWGCSGLTSVIIPDSVTIIGGYAFFGCTGLTSVTIGNGVTNIGIFVFAYCIGLTSVTIPDSVTSIGNGAFLDCIGLTSVTIPDSVTSIGSGAFANCSGLTSVTIPDSVTSIGNSAFSGCTGLTSITIPDSVTSIGIEAFLNCISLTSVIIPDSVTSIGSGAFANCTRLTSVTIPAGVTNIAEGAFFQTTLTAVFYGGTNISAWNRITIGSNNILLLNARRYYYSEIDPGTINTHWRWVDGEPVVWYENPLYSGTATINISFYGSDLFSGETRGWYLKQISGIWLFGNMILIDGSYTYCTAYAELAVF